MTEPCFIAAIGDAGPGSVVEISGAEGHHAAAVRRIGAGESVLVTDGAGSAVRGPAVEIGKNVVRVRVVDRLSSPARTHRWIAVQALTKGPRADLAVETLTELGVDEIIAWQASRSISRWSPDKRDKGLAKWRATAREATKQSRRFTVPQITFATSIQVAGRIGAADAAFVLHESATAPIRRADLPASGDVILIVGPEGGISPDELQTFTDAGGHPVRVADAVLRASTAPVVGLAQLQALASI
ncbi:16S rRNA (uracil(1498)-N(3))-methyltransferase [Acidipropionibacterium virtanenii]|uniref:Ribosomal RNA small subunit methyltransferase E n=1 Tax=Acidipropionibacterium virtanenii TaxID=2057246 RepID=A0A344UUY0_9ACTN|nr:16S rRNA (uracil(1498)-N(3))-methyltransferase [Acidipropionibacterium virtanenii]AXE39078.1 Ribosomal RNA small subunit methyltransferase E [Acidipropionibacterium virtanenii]